MNALILTLFPEFFDGPLRASIMGRAIEAGRLRVDTLQIRDFATDKHNTVDDTPYGGGAGMVMRATELAAATRAAKERVPNAPVILMSPQGPRLDQSMVRRLARYPELIFVCGRYEGLDERYIENHVDFELSVGDFVLTGGEPAALCVMDAVCRFVPGVLGNAESAVEESFGDGLLEHPQFTRPAEFEGATVPPVLVSGDHGRVDRWRRRAALERTRERRPDLFAEHGLSADDERILADESLVVPEAWIRPKKLPDPS